jgi:predicted O-linked N-acetylglucosamine transferase (SPINDLY family)
MARALRRLFSVAKPPDPAEVLGRVMALVSAGDLAGARASAALLEAPAVSLEYLEYARALIAEGEGDLAAALGHAGAAMREFPGEPVYWLKCAQLTAGLGRHRDSVDLYRRLIDLEDGPFRSDPAILFDFAAACEKSGDAAATVDLLERLLALRPDHAAARANLSMLLALAGRDAAARAHMNILLRGGDSLAGRLKRAMMLPAIHESLEHIAEVRGTLARELDELLDMPVEDLREPAYEVGLAPFMLAYQGCDNTALLRKLGQVVRRHYRAASSTDRADCRPGARIRIGFVSKNFHAHSVARTTHGLIHDLPRDRFEVSAFAIEPRSDPWANTIRASAEAYIALPGDPARIRAAISAARLDVLFFADIGMDPLTYFLAFWRLAPIQMTTWGHPVTSGIDSIDYYISAATLEAEGADARYTERLVRLPGYFMPRYRKPDFAEARRSSPDQLLDLDRNSYFCAQTAFKLHPDFDCALQGILERDPRAEILLMETTTEMGARTRMRLERTLGPLAARVRMLPRLEIGRFLRMLADADVLLDPFHFGGCNSSCEALGLGAPTVTLPSPFLAGSFTRACYAELGIDTCVASTPEDYVEIALRLGTDAGFREHVSTRIVEGQQRLFDRPDAGRHLADALERIVRDPTVSV